MYKIVRMQVYKEYLFLLSVVDFSLGTSAFWTTHKVAQMPYGPLKEIAAHFQKAHDKQIRKMIREEEAREPEEFRIKSIEDQTKKAAECL